ncbi:MAG: type IV pilus secretin PilQ [Nitrospirae bacterium]|nr:type IV pilus secretin PilQ [Nitrospirota bacterium]
MKKYSIFILAILICLTGCATAGGGSKGIGSASNPTLIAIDIVENQLNVMADKPFTYTIYKSADPYKIIVDLPDVRLGIPSNKLTSNKGGITEVVISQTDNPLSAKLEVLLAAPSIIEPFYKTSGKDTFLVIKAKDETEVKSAMAPQQAEETATVATQPEKKTEDNTASSEKAEQHANEVVKQEDVAKAEPEVVVKPAAEAKEEKAVSESRDKAVTPKEFPPATAIVQVNISKEQNLLKVIIKGNGSLSPDVFRLDNRAVLDMPNVVMSAALPQKTPSPLTGIRSGKHKDKTRLVFDMKEGTNFDVAAIEDSVIVSFRIPEKERLVASAKAPVETKAAVVEPEKLAEGKYKGQKISLDFQDADIGPIFRLLADISGYNFVIDPSVRGKITMKLMNVPWDQALDIILQTFSLGKSAEGNIIWIAPVSLFTKMAEERTKAKDIEEKAEDITQEIIRINYATASEVSSAIDKGKLLSSRGSITIDNRMNTLIIKDTQKSIDRMKELVKIMDVAKPQVLIEAKIVEVSSDYSESLGIKWGGSFVGTGIRNVGQDVSGGFSINTPTVSTGSSVTNPGGVLGLSIGGVDSVKVNLSLSALESVGKSKKLANPKILTMDNESATIQQGTSVPVQTTSAEGTKTEFVNATLNLTVTPKITPEGYVQLKIQAANDSLGILTPQGYAIERKSLTTQALVKNGETLVIGGIYTTSTVESEEGVPLLGKIPILGWLFKTKSQVGPSVKELLVFITPTIVTKP